MPTCITLEEAFGDLILRMEEFLAELMELKNTYTVIAEELNAVIE